MSARDKKNPRILAIIPAFNEEKSIAHVVDRVQALAEKVDVLVINDRSTDKTEAILRQQNINHISLPINLGIGGAVQTGFVYAFQHDYDIALQVDGDGQHPPEAIPQLIAPIVDDRADVVIGSRYLYESQIVSSWARRLGSGVLASLIFVATGNKITDPTSGFRAFNKKAIYFLSQYYPQEYPEPISTIELLENGFRLQEVPVEMMVRQFGRSSITGMDTFLYMIKVIFAIIIVKLRRRTVLCQTQ